MTDINDIDPEFFRYFFELVTVYGLSPMEAYSFALIRIMNYTPSQAAEIISNSAGKGVSNSRASMYCQRGLVKLRDTDIDCGELDLETLLIRKR